MPEDQRKWNVPRCAKEIRELQARLDAISGPSGEVSAPTKTESDTPYPEFQAWMRQGLLDVIHNDGAGAVSWKRLHVVTSTLAAAWAGLMLTSGQPYDEVMAFMDWSNEKSDYVRGFQNEVSRGRRHKIVRGDGHDDNQPVAVAENPEIAIGAVGDDNRNLYAVLQETGQIKVPDDE